MQEVEVATVAALGLDATALDFHAPEVVAESLRRAASVRCPCRRQTLVRAVMQTLRSSPYATAAYEEQVEEMVETLLAYGDLIEAADTHDPDAPEQVYLAPLAFTRRVSGLVLLFGLAPDYGSTLPEDWNARVERVAHVRRLPPSLLQDALPVLADAGYSEMSATAWERAPATALATAVVGMYDERLQASGPSGTVEELTVLDPERSVRYYNGRWVELRRQTGTFVAKRRRTYGSTQWCYVRARDGVPEQFLALPTATIYGRGADEAWRLQMAIDATRGTPQRYRLEPTSSDAVRLQVFSPVPRWAQRRWDALGERLVDRRGCLFSYALPASEVDEERHFLSTHLWMHEDEAREGRA